MRVNESRAMLRGNAARSEQEDLGGVLIGGTEGKAFVGVRICAVAQKGGQVQFGVLLRKSLTLLLTRSQKSNPPPPQQDRGGGQGKHS